MRQCVVVANGAACGIHQQAQIRCFCQELLVANVVSGEFALAVERRVKCDDMAVRLHFLDGGERCRTLFLGAWWVAEQHLKAHLLCPSCHDRAHMPNAYHTHHQAAWLCDAFLLQPISHGAEHPLRHGRSVAPRSVHHLDAGSAAVVKIDVVGANRGCANHSHTASRKQCLIAACACARDEHIGIFERRGGDVGSFEIKHLGVRLEQAGNVGNMVFNYDFHFFYRK